MTFDFTFLPYSAMIITTLFGLMAIARLLIEGEKPDPIVISQSDSSQGAQGPDELVIGHTCV